MRRPVPILAVLLGASLLGNAVLATRMLRTSATPHVAGPVPGPRNVAAGEEKFETERKLNASLRKEIERLEADKKVLAQASPADPAVEQLSQFRESLRKHLKAPPDPTAKSGTVDADSLLEASQFMAPFFKMASLKQKEPRTYADHLRTFFEVELEGEGTALTAAQ